MATTTENTKYGRDLAVPEKSLIKSKITKTLKFTELESFVHRYGYNSGILLHRDHVGTKKWPSQGKRFGITLYLNDEWKPNWGGELIIYEAEKNEYFVERDSCEPVDVILPKRNRLVIIDNSWHKVSPNLNKNIDRLVIQTFITLSFKTNQ